MLLDQWTKRLVLASDYLKGGGDIDVIPHLFKFVYVINTGAAWGIFAGRMKFLAALSAIVFIFVWFTYDKLTSGWRERCLAISLIMGGILGNLIDRLFYEGVVDFLLVYYQSWSWPAFNIADSAICVGVAIYLTSSFLRPENPEEAASEGEPPANPSSAS